MSRTDIAAEIRAINEQVLQAFNEHDPGQILAFIDKHEDLHYVEHTTVTIGWETLKNGFDEWHKANLDLSMKQTQAHVNVLSDEIAVLTTAGEIYQAGQKIQKMTWTAVFQRKRGAWKIVNAHEAVSGLEDQDG